MSLYQKVRPDTLAEIVGNPATVKAMEKMLKSEEHPHAILISGSSGCGKTTAARILAREFGASENSVFELNAANTRGIDNIREITVNAQKSTIDGNAKVYIFDESHQLTASAQECLLKILEDHPRDCYFIFCTTEPKNIIPTIRNRCTKFEMASLSEGKIRQLLDNVVKKAGIEVKPEILDAVAVTSEGSPRAAIVALETVMEVDNLDDAINLLLKGTEKDVEIIELCKLMYAAPAVRKQKWQLILQKFDALDGEPENIRKAILGYLYKKLVTAENINEAEDLSNLIQIFSFSVFYGGKATLGSLFCKAILGSTV